MSLKCFFITACSLLFSSLALSQDLWQLKKDQNGIKIWKASTHEFSFKIYKAETTIAGDLEEVKSALMNLDNIALFKEGISEISEVQWIAENEVQFICNPTLTINTTPILLKRRYAPVEVGSYEINTTVVPHNTEGKEPIHTNKYFSLWILINAGSGTTFVKHIISNNPSERNPDWMYQLRAVSQIFTGIENLKRIVE